MLSYFPPILRRVREYRAVADAQQPEMERLWDAFSRLYIESFVLKATAHGIGKWEAILGLHPRETQSLEERRFAVLSRLTETLPYTLPWLRRVLDTLCGAGSYQLSMDGFVMNLKLALYLKNNLDAIKEMLERILPAHIKFSIGLLYNRHEMLGRFRYGELSGMSCCGLREKELPAQETLN